MFIGAVCSLFSYFLILTYNYWKLVKTFLQGWGLCASFFFARRGIFSPKFPAREERLAISNKFPGGLPNGGVRAWNWFMHYSRGTNFKFDIWTLWCANLILVPDTPDFQDFGHPPLQQQTKLVLISGQLKALLILKELETVWNVRSLANANTIRFLQLGTLFYTLTVSVVCPDTLMQVILDAIVT